MLFLKFKITNKIDIPLKYLDVFQRTMLNAAVKTRGSLTMVEKTLLAKAGLNFIKTITEPNIVESIAQANSMVDKKLANLTLTRGIFNHINSDCGTTVMNTNLSATIMTNIEMPLDNISKIYTNEKIIYPKIPNKTIPIRCAIEYPIVQNFLNNMDKYIEAITITADSIAIPGRTTNINRDLLIQLKKHDGDNGMFKNIIDKDIKAGKLDLDKLTSGHLRQLQVYNNELVSYPNDFCTNEVVVSYYTKYVNILKSVLLMEKIKLSMSASDTKKYIELVNQANYILKNSTNILENSAKIEQKFILINTLQGSPNMSFLNIYKISEQSLTCDEMIFLNKLMPYIDSKVLQKESYMRNYLIEALKIYREKIDPNSFKQLKLFSKFYPWIKNALIDLPIDFYT